MATAGYKGRIDLQRLTTGVLDVGQVSGTIPSATTSATASGWEQLTFTNATLTTTRETDDITENMMNREFDAVLFNWSMTVDFVRKVSGQTGFTAQQAIFQAEQDETQRLYVRLVDAPSGTATSPKVVPPAAGDVAKFGQAIVTGITETNDVGTDVRVSVTLQGTGPLTRADIS